MSETNVLYIPNHRELQRQRMLSQFRDKPRLMALMAGCARGIQELEDITFSLIVSRSLELATGAQLDQWGRLVGEERLGLVDAEYRRFIEARILVNRCNSTTDELIVIWEKITGGTVRHRDLFPAGLQLETVRPRFLEGPTKRRVRRMMVDVRPMGVTMLRVEALAGGFGFGSPWTGFSAGGFARTI